MIELYILAPSKLVNPDRGYLSCLSAIIIYFREEDWPRKIQIAVNITVSISQVLK